jgi:hypothetical protein
MKWGHAIVATPLNHSLGIFRPFQQLSENFEPTVTCGYMNRAAAKFVPKFVNATIPMKYLRVDILEHLIDHLLL